MVSLEQTLGRTQECGNHRHANNKRIKKVVNEVENIKKTSKEKPSNSSSEVSSKPKVDLSKNSDSNKNVNNKSI